MSFTAVGFLSILLICESFSVSDKDPRIIEGEISSEGQFPYAVGFYYEKGGTTNFCGGSIISKRLILTAAHCIKDATNFTIHLGSNDLQQTSSKGLIITTTKYIPHPSFVSGTFPHDIGFIVLDENIEYTDNVQPIQLPTSTLGSSQDVVAVGWGAVSDAAPAPSNILYHVSLKTITNLQCMGYYQSYVTDNMVCVQGTGNHGTCRGDSGGPLVQTTSDGKKVHVALAIFHSGQGCQTNQPSGFTRTFEYLEWIGNVTRDNPDNTPSSASAVALFLPLLTVLSILNLL